jgi:hypothetical protein
MEKSQKTRKEFDESNPYDMPSTKSDSIFVTPPGPCPKATMPIR